MTRFARARVWIIIATIAVAIAPLAAARDAVSAEATVAATGRVTATAAVASRAHKRIRHAKHAAHSGHVGHAQAAAEAPTETLTVPSFGRVSIYAPAAAPKQVVLFISGDGGWNQGVVSMATRLRDLGALVVGIDIRAFMKSLEQSTCAYPAGALEELSRAVQLHRKLPAYLRPILAGYSSGATLVYAALAAAPPETFAGGLSLGFCADLEIHTAPCHMRGLTARKKEKGKGLGYDLAPYEGLAVPWMVLQGDTDQVCDPNMTRAFVGGISAARLFWLPKVGHGFGVPRHWDAEFVEAYQAIVTAAQAANTSTTRRPKIADGGAAANASSSGAARAAETDVSDLDLVEVPAAAVAKPAMASVTTTGTAAGVSATAAARDLMAIILTGDGGWAELDKNVAAKLAASGVPAIGWSSLGYYWNPRTPEQAASDLARIITHYTAAWKTSRVLLVGYSFGADALPFLVNRLPADVRAHVARVALLGMSTNATFEFHVAEWLGRGSSETRYPTIPETERLALPVTCLHGADETDSACLTLKGPHITVTAVGQGHHFSGEYGRIVDIMLRP